MKTGVNAGERLLWSAGSGVVTAAILGLWALCTSRHWVSPVFLPAPLEVWTTLREGMLDGDLGKLAAGTVERMFLGWLVASVLGIAAGAVLSMSAACRRWLQPSLEFMRPLPASAIVPLAIGFLGLSPSMVLVVIAFGAVWPVLLSTMHGFQSIEPRLREVAGVLRLSRTAFIFKIGLPNALPDALAGMRLSLTISLILAVVGEMLASQDGLGTAILLAARSFRASDLFAGVALLSLIGFVSNFLLLTVQHFALPWKRATH
ncbi:ABC transporter permease [Paraburkholderia tropica]|uniref:ABC transporter permease n=1 Tax=Paraburkholderia tropica TaxID=92647 RepID=UPI002AAFC124|nr:ABC transporter permease [Paraburkholderia tropica]